MEIEIVVGSRLSKNHALGFLQFGHLADLSVIVDRNVDVFENLHSCKSPEPDPAFQTGASFFPIDFAREATS